jgi:predicted nucleic acid-binding protein
MIVSDTNLLVGLFLREDAVLARVLERDPVWAAPPLWRSEFCNALAGFIRVEGLPPSGAIEGFDRATQFVEEHAVESRDVLRLIPESRCSAYDLEYLALARSLRVPLLTFDRQLLEAFPAVAVSPRDFIDRS